MRDVVEKLVRWWADGETVALATVVGTYRSAPRQPGASMLVGPDGEAVGSVSGGCVDWIPAARRSRDPARHPTGSPGAAGQSTADAEGGPRRRVHVAGARGLTTRCGWPPTCARRPSSWTWRLPPRSTSVRRVAAFAERQVRRPGAGQVRRALALASEHSRSPQETRLRLVWVLDAGLPPPLVNCQVSDLAGGLVGVADLLDVEAGVAGEYDGAAHRSRARHRRDNDRIERFRGVSLETFTVVAGDDVTTQVARMRAARGRAGVAPAGERRWVVPPLDPRELMLDQRLDERDLLAEIRADER